MAYAVDEKSETGLNFLTDCMFFINGHCKLDNNCRFRHCREAAEQINNCSRWPKKCRNVTCPYRHPTMTPKTVKKKPPVAQALVARPDQVQPPILPVKQREGFISIFWDIENVPIPKGQRPFDIVQRIREKLVREPGLQEVDFTCYCNSITISEENQRSLSHATVRIVHVPDRKVNAVDRQIMLDLDRFERVHRPPATVVLISGDIDFIGKLSDLRHQARFHVIVIHNKPAKEELKATVNEHYPWEFFTHPQALIHITTDTASGGGGGRDERHVRGAEPIRKRHASVNNIVRRRDPSPAPRFVLNRQQPIVNNVDVKKYQCPKCLSEFETVQSLRQHQNAVKHFFPCGVCEENFFTSESQKQHQKDKNHYALDYKCPQCKRFFAKIESLNQHQQATGHQSPTVGSTVQNEPISQQNSTTSTSSSERDSKYDDQDPLDIILNGIEAIKDFYSKRASKCN